MHLIVLFSCLLAVKAGLIGNNIWAAQKVRPPYDCGMNVRQAEIGKPIIIETPNYPSKVSWGVNCVIKIKADRGNNIIIRWSGFVVDGCHEGNKIRIVDGDQQQFHCGDKRPPTYVSSTSEVEIAISVVNMQRKDRGVIYRFSYEASKPRRLAGRRLATGKTLVSKFDESSSLLEKQQIRKTVVQTPQAPQKPQQNTQGQQNTQDRRPLGFQGQDYRSGSQGQIQGQQHPQHSQQAPQGHNQSQDQNSQGQHSQGQQGQPIIPLRPMSPRIRQRPATMSPQANQYDEMYRYEYSEVDEVLEKEKSPTQWERIRPYVGLGGAVIAVIIPLVILIKYGLNWKEDRAKSLNNYT